MAYSAVPSRSSSDSVLLISDINQLQSNITAMLEGIAPFKLLSSDPTGSPASGYMYLYFKTDKKLYKKDSAGTVTEIGAGGGGGGDEVYNFPARLFDWPSSKPAPLDTDTGTNGQIKRLDFDKTTEEYVLGIFKLPSDISSFTKAYFELEGYAVTADGNEVQFAFNHSARNSGESWDSAFTEVLSGDVATSSDQDEYDYITWNETISNLGWAADDVVRFKLSRHAITGGTTVNGDYGVVHFRVRLSAS